MILVDSGVIVAAAVRNNVHNHSCVELIVGLHLAKRRLLLPATVIAEVGYLIEHYGGPREGARFLRSAAEGDFTTVELIADDYARMAELVETYDDSPLGTTDASVIAG